MHRTMHHAVRSTTEPTAHQTERRARTTVLRPQHMVLRLCLTQWHIPTWQQRLIPLAQCLLMQGILRWKVGNIQLP